MKENIIMIHDSEIQNYTVDFGSDIIKFEIITYDDKNATIVFNFPFAYDFQNHNNYQNILRDISEGTIDEFVKHYEEFFQKKFKNYWPAQFKSVSELKNVLIDEHYKPYYISASNGLEGWIIAKSMEVNMNSTEEN